MYLFELPWEKHKTYKCTEFTKTSDYIKIDLKASDMKNRVLHFWGNTVPIDKKDYQYFACAFDFWVSGSANGLFTATSGIDTKNEAGTSTVSQIYCSRGLTCTTVKKTQWGQTIPNSEYVKCNGASLNQLFAADDNYQKETTNNAGSKKGGSDSSGSGTKSGNSGNTSNNGSTNKSSNTGNNSDKGSSNKSSAGNQNKDTVTEQIKKHSLVDGNSISKDDDEYAEQNKSKKQKVKAPIIVNIVPRSTSFTLQWKNKAPQAKGYQIQYGTDIKLKKGVKTVKVKKKNVTKKVIDGLKKGTLYYIRVRAYSKNAKGTTYSKWSKIKEVKVKR